VAGPCEHSNELSVSINGRQFLDQLSYYQLLKKDSAPRSSLVSWLVSNGNKSPYFQH
jgi:hypothetical protein